VRLHPTGAAVHYYFRNGVWRPALAASRVSRARARALRYYFASSLLAGGVPITAVAAWHGHTSPEITLEYYGHLMPDAPHRGHAAINNAMAPLASTRNRRQRRPPPRRTAPYPAAEATADAGGLSLPERHRSRRTSRRAAIST